MLIEQGYAEQLVGPIARDSTATEAREKPASKEKRPKPPKRKRGRKGEERPKEPNQWERPRTMGLEEMLEELPKPCTVGVTRHAKGCKPSWRGYKLTRDVADGGVPIRHFVSSASLRDSQAEMPQMTKTAQRAPSLYDLMDSTYDAKEIPAHSKRLGHAPIMDAHPRRKGKAARSRERKVQRAAGLVLPHRARYKERSTVERALGRLKDEFGGRPVRVRGHKEVTCHLMFGGLVLTADPWLRLVHGTQPWYAKVADIQLPAQAGAGGRDRYVRAPRMATEIGHDKATVEVEGLYLPRETGKQGRHLT